MGLYQNIVNPRFWVPITPYLKQTNSISVESDTIDGVSRLIDLDPYDPVIMNIQEHTITFRFSDTSWIDESQKYFIGMLGQKFASDIEGDIKFNEIDNQQFYSGGFESFNHSTSLGLKPEYNGLYLREFFIKDSETLSFTFTCNKLTSLGSFFIGKVYDSTEIPQSPNADVNFIRSYNNNKTVTDAGLQYSNSHYMTTPIAKFYEMNDNGNQLNGRSDLRSWDLSYSNINEQKLFSKSDSLNVVDSNQTEIETYNFYKDNNVFTQLIHFTQGDALPFIFQSDENNFMPDQFALCRFGVPELKIERDSLNTYRYSISVLEEF